jgi:hypothetical protein
MVSEKGSRLCRFNDFLGQWRASFGFGSRIEEEIAKDGGAPARTSLEQAFLVGQEMEIGPRRDVNARSAKARPTRDGFEKVENLRASALRRQRTQNYWGDKGEIGRRVSGPLTGSHRPRRE